MVSGGEEGRELVSRDIHNIISIAGFIRQRIYGGSHSSVCRQGKGEGGGGGGGGGVRRSPWTRQEVWDPLERRLLPATEIRCRVIAWILSIVLPGAVGARCPSTALLQRANCFHTQSEQTSFPPGARRRSLTRHGAHAIIPNFLLSWETAAGLGWRSVCHPHHNAGPVSG